MKLLDLVSKLSIRKASNCKVFLTLLSFISEPIMLADLLLTGCCQWYTTFCLNTKPYSPKPNLCGPLPYQDKMALLNKQIFHSDGTHLSKLGNDLFLNNLPGVIEHIMGGQNWQNQAIAINWRPLPNFVHYTTATK